MSFGFLCLTRDAGQDFWPLAEQIAAVIRAGDEVVLVDDGPEGPAAEVSGRFSAMVGWGAQVRVVRIATATRGDGNLDIAATIALDATRAEHVILLPGRARLHETFAAARDMVGDALILPHLVRDPDRVEPLIGQAFSPHAVMMRRGLAQAGDLASGWRFRNAPRFGSVALTLPYRPVGPEQGHEAATLLKDSPVAADWLRAEMDQRMAGRSTGIRAGVQDFWPFALSETLPAPAIAGQAEVSIWMEGPHTRRSPFAYAHLNALWPDIHRAENAASADLVVLSHPQDALAISAETARDLSGKTVALISEEPFWDTIFSPDPLAPRVTLRAAHLRELHVHQVNHHLSPIFEFTHVPYFLLTEAGYIQRYAEMFARNAVMTAADWKASMAQREWPLVFMAERRPEPFHDVSFPEGQILGLCAWRTRLAEACGFARRFGASWQGGEDRFALADWHGDKIARLDGRAGVISALENTHQPTYLSEKLFDAFACGAVPAAMAGPGHLLHRMGLPAGSWINLWGMDVPEAAQLLRDPPVDHEAFVQAQRLLRDLFTDTARIGAERARLSVAVRAEVERLVALGPA